MNSSPFKPFKYQTALEAEVRAIVIHDRKSYVIARRRRSNIQREVSLNLSLSNYEQQEHLNCWGIVNDIIEKWEEENPEYLI